MEFALEGILETLLVGGVSSLWLLTPLFLLFGHMFRLGPIQKLFVFLLYERDEEVSNKGTSEIGETHKVFLVMLMLAGLFGLGVLTESFSKNPYFDPRGIIFDKTDEAIRLKSLEDVALSVLGSGEVDRKFARFASDFVACRELDRRQYKTSEASDGPCQTVLKRGNGFYYAAKNAIFRTEAHYEELSRMQARIDFTRAVSLSLAVLGGMWLFAFLPASFAEWKRKEILEESSGSEWHELKQHWLRLSAKRCLISAIILLLASVAVMLAWSDLEEYYDKRVFGYYLGSTPGETNTSNMSNILPAVRFPVSPFLPFQNPAGKAHFEPSAVVLIEDSILLVANDKDVRQPLSQFALGLDHRILGAGRPLRIPKANWVPEEFGKIESMHFGKAPNGGILLMAGNFDARYIGADSIYRLSVSVHEGEVNISTVQRLEFSAPPCAVFGVDKTCIIEGMASRDVGREILLGVRYVVDKDGKRPTFAIVRLTPDAKTGQWTPDLMFETQLALAYQSHGISSLDVAADGAIVALTSGETSRDATSKQGKSHRFINEVMGAVWRIPSEVLEKNDSSWGNSARPVLMTIHKPEGLALLDRRDAFIVFDDDADRKGFSTLPDTFALDHEESVYGVFRIAP